LLNTREINDAFWNGVKWEEVSRRYENALKATGVK